LGLPKSSLADHIRSTKKETKTSASKLKSKGRKPRGFSKSTSGEAVADEVITSYLKAYRADPFLSIEGGSKALGRYLKRDHGVIVNHKKIYRLCKEQGLLLPRVKKKQQKFIQLSANRLVCKPNQVWEFDIKYGYLQGLRRFFYLVAFIDVFTRQVRGWHVGLTAKAGDLIACLALALKENPIEEGCDLTIRSDHGPQMRAHAFAKFLEDKPVGHEFIPVRTPNKNAHIESFFSIYDKHLAHQYFWDLKDAYLWTNEFIGFYNSDRIHGSLGMSPEVFANRKEIHDQPQWAQAI
jgi:putative transposase